jgi:hypothetical protein
MGYYIRVLSTSSDSIPISKLESALDTEHLQATLDVEAATSDEWEQLILRHSDGPEIAAIERNLVEDGSFGKEELAEFAEMIPDCKPESAAQWLLEYLPRVRCIYAFQLLSGTDHKNGWDILAAVKGQIWSFAPSILQADEEGFTNEDGYHILWQFNEPVTGTWWMGVLRDGKWVHFQMDLANLEHRAMFLRGEVPDGAILAS